MHVDAPSCVLSSLVYVHSTQFLYQKLTQQEWRQLLFSWSMSCGPAQMCLMAVQHFYFLEPTAMCCIENIHCLKQDVHDEQKLLKEYGLFWNVFSCNMWKSVKPKWSFIPMFQWGIIPFDFQMCLGNCWFTFRRSPERSLSAYPL